jgi:ATF/CREB family transcription factor
MCVVNFCDTGETELVHLSSCASEAIRALKLDSNELSIDSRPSSIPPHPQPPTVSAQVPSEQKPDSNANQRDVQKNNTQQNDSRPRDTPDYFSLPRPNRLDQEPNPFEQSFASGGTTTGSADPLATPKAILPPVTAMTSPAPLLGSSSYNWGPNSLRSGPLSPAMLQGPANTSSLGFDTLRTGLTPNESGIRSGLTPGGSGSMFPAPSPSTSQFLFGGGTPGTMEFQKTALSAARKSTHSQPPLIPPQTELKTEDNLNHPHPNSSLNDQSKPRQQSDPFHADPAHNAANGLYLLAQMGAPPNSYQASHIGIPPNATNNMDSNPSLAKRAAMNSATSAANRAASNSAAPNGVRGMSEASNHRSDSSEEPENAAGRKGRAARGKAATTATGKRKNDGSSDGGKTATNKKAKSARATSDDGEMEDYDEEEDGQDGVKKDGKKMTDEEKRKNFLERNRYISFLCARCKGDHD